MSFRQTAPKFEQMDHSNQFFMFTLLITALLTAGTQPIDDLPLDWFEAQKQCLGHGLTTESDKSDKPYWTGVYRRLTPWINILGCYPDIPIKSPQDVDKKTMNISSVGLCQEMCNREHGYKFAIQMNNCLCIKRDVRINTFNRLSPSHCNIKCMDNTDVVYSGDCGGNRAYNVYEIQEGLVSFNTVDTCLSLQCSSGDRKFIPKRCSESLDKVCENLNIPDTSFASSWNTSMEQCKKSQDAGYLLGKLILNNPRLVCTQISPNNLVAWVGVKRQKYKNVDRGYRIKEEDKGTFQDCQMCIKNECFFRSCHDLVNSSIFCHDISDTSQRQVTANITPSQKSFSTSTLMSNHSTSEELIALTFTTRYDDTDRSPSTNDMQQMSSARDELTLKISLPVITVFIILLLCAMAVVFYLRRGKMSKTDRTTKREVKSVPEKHPYSQLDFSQSNSSFTLEQCYQKISKGSNSLNESPYNNSEEGVNDHLTEKQAQEMRGNYMYQNALTDFTGHMSRYETIANANNKNQEGEAAYDHLH